MDREAATGAGGMFNAALRGGVIGGFLGGSLQSILDDAITGMMKWATGAREAEAATARHALRTARLREGARQEPRDLGRIGAERWFPGVINSDRSTRTSAKQAAKWNALSDKFDLFAESGRRGRSVRRHGL